MGGKSRGVRSPSLAIELLKSLGLYQRSLGLFLLLVVAVIIFSQVQALRANDPVESFGFSGDPNTTIYYDLASDGNLYLGRARANAEVFSTDSTFRYRLQVIDQPNEIIPELNFVVRLPFSATEETVGYRLINNGGAGEITSILYDPRTLLFTATNLSTQTQLAIEFEVPRAFITKTALSSIRETLSALPTAIWAGISIGLPSLAVLILLITAMARNRKVVAIRGTIEEPPSRLSPVMVGILMRGRISSRDIAATFIDLAHRGHLIIRHLSNDDFRFRRHSGVDRLEDFEQALLDQIFGVSNERSTSEEISFSLAQEVFSKRISNAFILAYKKIGELGFFSTNPLKLHLRYQLSGLVLFLLGITGFFVNLFLISQGQVFLFFWIGMIISSLLVLWFAKGIPARTIYGDKELAKWMSFRKFLSSKDRINYAAHSQEKYLSYLPYAMVLEVESEWTRKFYDMPFFQPTWYIAPNINTVDQFANKVFPLLGYLSHALAVTTEPSAR